MHNRSIKLSQDRYPRNLNKVALETDHMGIEPPVEFDACVAPQRVSIYFDDLADHLCAAIRGSDLVLGCVAWLTHPLILDALAEVNCLIVVQKEDFLRPDCLSGAALRTKYAALHNGHLHRFNLPSVKELSSSCDPGMEAVRCVGNHNIQKAAAFPRMHNKFAVFCKEIKKGEEYVPMSVWTGSFNWSNNAGNSFENAVHIFDRETARVYERVWAHIFGLSEPLDWSDPWMAPEYRLGT